MAGEADVVAVRAIAQGGEFDVVLAIRLLAKVVVLLAADASELSAGDEDEAVEAASFDVSSRGGDGEETSKKSKKK
jgi:hypothetical protein